MFNLPYFKYLLKKQIRYLILICLITFIALPFTAITTINHNYSANTTTDILYIIAMMLGFIISFITPLFLLSYIQNKKGCNLYFSLPIKRESLFVTTHIFGLIGCITPVLLNYLIACLFIHGELLTVFYYGFALFFCMVISYGISLFASVKTNNIIDSLVIATAYHIVPCIVTICLLIFFENVANHFMLGTGSYANAFNQMIYYLSVPGFSTLFLKTFIEQMNSILLIYWLIVGLSLFLVSYRVFLKRKAENANERSTSFITYPFLLICFIASVAFGIYSSHINWINYIILFAFYMIAYSFSQRKISFNYKVFLSYILIIVASLCLAFVTERTHGLGLIREEMDYQKQDKWEIYIDSPHPFTNISQEPNNISLYTNEITDTQSVKEFQNKIISIAKKYDSLNDYQKQSAITIHMNLKHKNQYRSYYIPHHKIKDVGEDINTLIDENKNNKSIMIDKTTYEKE